MKLFQLNKISDAAVTSVADSFNKLPHTNHKDGEYRLRRYSVIELRTSFWNAKEESEIERQGHRVFNQSEDYNKHQGGMDRDFKEIEDSVLQSEGMKEICLAFKHAFNLIDGQEIEIHQMRVATKSIAKVSPEGVHQDGYNYIAVVGIRRFNVHGGEFTLHNNEMDSAFMTRALKDGEIAMVRDDYLWHNATPISVGGGIWRRVCRLVYINGERSDMTPPQFKVHQRLEKEKAQEAAEQWVPKGDKKLKTFIKEMEPFKIHQEDVPLIIKLVENPNYATSKLFTGAVDLFTHDCIHALLGRGLLPKDEAFVIGYTMGSGKKMARWRRNLFMFVSKHFYPKGYDFGEEERLIFNLAVLAGSQCSIDLSEVNFKELLDLRISEIRRDLRISYEIIKHCYGLEKRCFKSTESRRLL